MKSNKVSFWFFISKYTYFNHETSCAGNYKVEVFDKVQNKYVPTVSGLGMHVEVRDPDDNTVMSRVRVIKHARCVSLALPYCSILISIKY